MRVTQASTLYQDLALRGGTYGTRAGASSGRTARLLHTFSDALRDAAPPSGRSNGPVSPAASAAVRQEDSRSSSRIQSAATPSAAAETPAAAEPSAATPACPEVPAMVALRAKLAEMGFNTSGLQMNYTEEVVGYPGGSYTNRLIQVTNGSTSEKFDAALTLRNPQVTAVEMAQIFNLTR